MQATNSEFQYILERDATFRYQFLDRLRLDCRYYLTTRYWKDLWAGNVEDQIDLMRDIYKSFDEKPEWTSMEEIDDLAKQMGYKTNKNLYIMTTTEFFITLLSDFLNKRETVQPEENVNWEELIKVAKLHEMVCFASSV